MTDRKIPAGKLMAAVSVLGLALGMTAQAADTTQQKNESTQIKLDTTQIKGETTQIKNGTNQIKGVSHQGKFTGFLKHNTATDTSTQIKVDDGLQSNQHKLGTGGSTQLKLNSTQIKLDQAGSNQHKLGTGGSTQIKVDDGLSTQIKHDTPSTELNPQPEPPKPDTGTQGSTPH